MPCLLIADEEIAALELRAGDVIIVDPDAPEPLTLCRELVADYPAIRRALAGGQLRPSDPEQPVPRVLFERALRLVR
jgi:hypothetical protein